MTLETRPFGLWESPLQSRDLARIRSLKDIAWDEDGRTLVWLERRGGDGVLVCQRGDQAPRDLDNTFSVRAQVGYGGGDFTVSRGQVYFAERSGRLYRQSLEAGPAQPLTPAFGRAAAPAVSRDGRWLIYVHSDADVDCLAVVDSSGAFWPQRLAEGADFYMQPAWHPRGRLLAWIEWDHPQMPWDGTRLVLGEVRASRRRLPRLAGSAVLAGDADTAHFQPQFSPDGRTLAYVSDQGGWSNLWLYDLETRAHSRVTAEESDIALPAWQQGMRVFCFSADGRRLYFTRTEAGFRRAFCCDLSSRRTGPVEELSAYAMIEQVSAAPKRGTLACIASSSGVPPRVLSCHRGQVRVHARSSGETIAAAQLARPRAISWPGAGDFAVHGIYYPPTSIRYESRGRPPAIVMVHGGPTSQADAGFNPCNQFFATRGYAVLDVNYRGSTGYGRKYVEALRRNWGVLDVEDAISGARHLVDSGLACGDGLVIMGGSAGGFTVLRALTVRPGFFRAAICSYGISNLFALAADTHKFEARYLDSLLGPLPESGPVYRDRSPLFSAEKLRDPIAIFHGSEDQVVPLEQARQIVEILRRRNVPHAFHVYEGEGHGWGKPQTITAFYEAVEAFLKRYVLLA